MRRLIERLPGPAPVRYLLAVVLAVIALAVLLVVFEYLGRFLDDGGVIG